MNDDVARKQTLTVRGRELPQRALFCRSSSLHSTVCFSGERRRFIENKSDTVCVFEFQLLQLRILLIQVPQDPAGEEQRRVKRRLKELHPTKK